MFFTFTSSQCQYHTAEYYPHVAPGNYQVPCSIDPLVEKSNENVLLMQLGPDRRRQRSVHVGDFTLKTSLKILKMDPAILAGWQPPTNGEAGGLLQLPPLRSISLVGNGSASV